MIIIITIIILIVLAGKAYPKEIVYSETVNCNISYQYIAEIDEQSGKLIYENNHSGNDLFGKESNLIQYTHSFSRIADWEELSDSNIKLILYFASDVSTYRKEMTDFHWNESYNKTFSLDSNLFEISISIQKNSPDQFEINIKNPNEKLILKASSISFSNRLSSGETDQNKPTQFELRCNYPNPFNPSTNIEYSLPYESKITLKIYNMVGQEVKTLIDKTLPAGVYSVEWDGKDQYGNIVSTGIYFYKIEAEGFSATRKMILLK